jgi:hypothetical protein
MGGRDRRRVGRREPDPQSRLDWTAHDRVIAGQGRCGRDRIRTCVGNAGDFTGRTAVSLRIPLHPRLVPIVANDVHKRPRDSFRRHSASPPVPARTARLDVGRREVGGKLAARQTSAAMWRQRRGSSRWADRTSTPTRAHHVACPVEQRRSEPAHDASVLAPASSGGYDRVDLWPLPCESESGGSLAWVDLDRTLVTGHSGGPLVSAIVRWLPFICGPDVAQRVSVG